MLKSFTIKWEGKEETVEYEDDIPFGDLEYIIKTSTDLTDILKPKLDVLEYRLAIVTRALRKAPFKIGDPAIIRGLPRSVGKIIADKIMADYPLIFLLADWMETVLGTSLKIDQSQLSKTSTGTVQVSSDGRQTK